MSYNPYDPVRDAELYEAYERNKRAMLSDTKRDTVPNENRSEQAKGQRDTRDTETAEERVSRLLAAVRDGAWLDAQQFPPLRYAVDGLIPEGFTVLVGAPKVGKSWLVGGLLLAVAAGGAALGRIRLGTKRRVLYLALEDGDRRMQDRCRKLLGPGEPLPELFCYVTRVDPGEVILTIEAFLDRYPDTAMVVIDTLGKVMPPAAINETTYQRDYRVGSRLKAIADERPGLALMAVHHDRKAGSLDFVERVSGTNGLAGAADTIILLDRTRQSREGLLMVTGRDVAEAEYALRMADPVGWELDGHDLAEAAENARRRAESAAGQVSDQTAAIIDFVRQHPEGVTRAEVVERFGENAGRYLSRHVDTGRLIRIGRGRYAVPNNGQPTNSVPTVPLSFSQVSDGTEPDTVPSSVPFTAPARSDGCARWTGGSATKAATAEQPKGYADTRPACCARNTSREKPPHERAETPERETAHEADLLRLPATIPGPGQRST